MTTVTRQTNDNQSIKATNCSTLQHHATPSKHLATSATPRNTNNTPIAYDHRSPNNISYKRYR